MKPIPQISEAEWRIMNILWAKHPLKASEIIDELKKSTDWHPKTVKTLLSRLVNKGAISYHKDKQIYLYFPVVSENECVKEETKSFINRVYKGSLNLLVKNFLENNDLTEKDIVELKSILEKKE
jgi:BlaI family penicillinase repressor